MKESGKIITKDELYDVVVDVSDGHEASDKDIGGDELGDSRIERVKETG